jgi:hypothetical protein
MGKPGKGYISYQKLQSRLKTQAQLFPTSSNAKEHWLQIKLKRNFKGVLDSNLGISMLLLLLKGPTLWHFGMLINLTIQFSR